MRKNYKLLKIVVLMNLFGVLRFFKELLKYALVVIITIPIIYYIAYIIFGPVVIYPVVHVLIQFLNEEDLKWLGLVKI